jgi:hypothetical protein
VAELPLRTDKRPLLPRIPTKRRGPLVSAFLEPIRASVTDPQQIVTAAVATIRRQIQDYGRWMTPQSSDELRATLLAVLGHPTEALALAAELIAYEALPREEKQRLKAERAEQSRQEYMASLPPTDKQLWYPRKLGVAITPSNRWEASTMIDARVGKGGGR